MSKTKKLPKEWRDLIAHMNAEMERAGRTRAQVAYESGVGLYALNDMMRGFRAISFQHAVKLDRYFGTDGKRTIETLAEAARDA